MYGTDVTDLLQLNVSVHVVATIREFHAVFITQASGTVCMRHGIMPDVSGIVDTPV